MERYEAYKDSGVEWIGEIPNSWQIMPIWVLATYNDEILPENTNPEYQFNYIDISSVSEGSIDSHSEQIFSSAPSRARRVVRRRDVLVSTVRTYLKAIALVDEEHAGYVASTGFCVLRPKADTNSRWFGYALSEESIIDEIVARSVGVSYPAINASDLVKLQLRCPPIEEQQAIADYLDAKTAEVDALVAGCEREVGLLREYRKAVISEAVTKGLDPDAPMKDSGVEWIGEIPASWVIVPFKAIGTVAANLQHPADYPDLPQVSPDRIEKDSGRLLPCFSVAEVGVESDNHVFHAGDILYSKVRPALNKVTVAPFDGMCSADMYPIESSQNKRWLVFYMLSNAFMEQVIVSTDRVKMPKINKEELGAFKVVLPSVDEQCEIAVYLDAKTAEIDSLIEAKQQMADKLREYRKSLISETVTGKFKVQGVR